MASISETVVTNFVGGSNSVCKLQLPTVATGSGNVTLTWSSVEGGKFLVSGSTDLKAWTTNVAPSVTASGIVTTAADAGAATTNTFRFYRVARTSLAASAN
jgi:hypothetical protein